VKELTTLFSKSHDNLEPRQSKGREHFAVGIHLPLMCLTPCWQLLKLEGLSVASIGVLEMNTLIRLLGSLRLAGPRMQTDTD
jgi:hypothetical protein